MVVAWADASNGFLGRRPDLELHLANDTLHHHHDMAWLPNGHVVLLAWEYKSPEEAAAAGRSDDDGPLWPPVLLEVVPEGDFGR